MKFCNLHLHDHYSALDGVGSPKEYMDRAAEIGMTHLAQTNHGTLMGHREFQREAKSAGITPILGLEAYLTTDRFDKTAQAKRQEGDLVYNHLTLLAQNENGLHNLNYLSEQAWTTGFYQKPRIDFELLEDNNQDIIALSGCLSGMIPKALTSGNEERANELMHKFLDIFGERFFIEIMDSNPKELNLGLMALAEKYNVKPVVTDDCHHVRKEDSWIQEAILILNTNPKFAKTWDMETAQKMDFLERFNYVYPDRKMTLQDFDLFLHTYEDHEIALAKQGIGTEPIENTMLIAESIGEYPYFEGLDLLPTPKGDPKAILRKKVYAGLKRLGKDIDQVYIDRVEHELEIIGDKNFDSYFLLAENAITWAESKDIMVGPGRGSAAGSLVCYCLGITKIDPIEYNLLFMRFLDPARSDWPDIDTDFQDSRRHEVKDYMRRKFGHVASIGTITYFKDNGMIKDASRILQVPLGEVNKALKNIVSYEQFLASPTTLQFRNKYPEVIKLCNEMRWHIRSTGIHAGGLVISKEPLVNYAPIQTAVDKSDPATPRVPLVAADMNEAANIGLIKFDFLGLKALSVLQETVNLIKQRHDQDFDLYKLPMNDAATYNMLSEGFTQAIFQCEQPAYTKTIFNMGGVHNFDELVASNALVRPGAANSSFAQKYIDGKAGNYDYIHECTQSFTENTYGSILYQEQQMLLCTELCGMSMGDANKVRKAIGKKKHEELVKWESAFVEGASEKISQSAAQDLWNDLLAASDYSFNLSHAVAYSTVSYWTAYLKRHYSVEFMAATLRNESNKDSIVDYVTEAKRLGIRIKLPHVNESGLNFEIFTDDKGDYIRFGLKNIKFISDISGSRLIQERPFRDYEHLYSVVMTPKNGLTTRVLEGLNAIGAAEFADNPRRGNEKENLFEYLNIPAFSTSDLPPKIKNEFRLLDDYAEDETFFVAAMVRNVKLGKGWIRIDMVDESGSAGAFTDLQDIESGKMYIMLISNNSIVKAVPLEALIEKKTGFTKFITLDTLDDVPDSMYKVVAFNVRTTKAGKKMANVVLSDNKKNLLAVLAFPGKDFIKTYDMCKEGNVVDVNLATTRDGTKYIKNVL